MKKSKSLVITILILVLIIGGAYYGYNKYIKEAQPNTIEENKTEEGSESRVTKAPDFTVYDGEGKEVKLSDFVGKPVVLNFWASWCGPCRSEMGDFNKVNEEVKDEVQFLMVNLTDGNRETIKSASNFVKEQSYTMPIFFDSQGDAATTYGVRSIPCTYFIDKDGKLVGGTKGVLSEETLRRGIDLIHK